MKLIAIIKAHYKLAKIREFVMSHSIGAYRSNFELGWSDGRGQWVAVIKIPTWGQDDVIIKEIEAVGGEWHEAVNNIVLNE